MAANVAYDCALQDQRCPTVLLVIYLLLRCGIDWDGANRIYAAYATYADYCWVSCELHLTSC